MDAGAWSCGMVVGLINDIPTVKELINRIMTEAEQIIRQRLTGFLEGNIGDVPARAVRGRHACRGQLSIPDHGSVIYGKPAAEAAVTSF
jgi:hypothetical protein